MNQTLAIERSIVINAQRERIWRALTTPAHFSKWFEMPISFEHLRSGEIITFEVDQQDEHGVIVEVIPPERFAFRWPVAQGYEIMTLVTFTLETVAEGTRVTITESGFEQLPESLRQARFADNDKGWQIQSENLAAFMRANPDV